MPVAQSPALVSINLFLLVMLYMLMRNVKSFPYRANPLAKNVSIVLSILFVLFSFWGSDWFHYLELYPNLHSGEKGHMEDVYVFIAQNLSIGYVSFRFFIWGTGILLYCFLVKRLSVNTDLALFFFLSIWLIWFSYARVSLAMIVIYLGGMLIYKPLNKKFISYISGIALIWLSIYLHKTASFAIIVVVLSSIFGLLPKKLFALIVPLFLTIVPFLISTFLMDFMTIDSFTGGVFDLSIEYGQNYLDAETEDMGLAPLIQRILEMTPYYMLALVSYMSLLRYNIAKDVAIYMKILIIIVIIASLFSLDYGLNTSVLYVRFMRFAFIPSAIVLTYIWSNNIYKKTARYIYYIALSGTFYSVAYSLYCSSVGN